MRIFIKSLLGTLLFSCSFVSFGAPNLNNLTENTYLGLDFALNKYSYSSTQPITYADKSRTHSLSPFIGYRFHQNFAAELGYVHLFDINPITDNLEKLKTYNIYLDLVGLYEIEQNLELLATLGVGRLDVDFSGVSHNEFFMRAAAGLHYHLATNFSMRFKFNWQKVGRDADLIKNTTSFGMGFIYNL